MTTHQKDEVYVCEACGHPTAVADDNCPNCGAPMTHFNDGVKHSSDDEDGELTDADIEAGSSEDGPLSLEALREDEEDDYSNNSDSSYNDL